MTSTPETMHEGGSSTRQKRVMPSRSRRGGPGIGSTDVDVMILETQKRKFENEPLIPAATKFLLTTNSSYIPSSSSSSTPFELNSHAYERYFDRPEVLESYKAQSIIQTPEFSSLAESASVGGRFRPRLNEEDITDTSDAAYEKRHRKYETFEKRQRLREKEKLKHEQYKLKERIEQLRAMDGSAFLALPASQFSLPLNSTAENITAGGDDPDSEDIPIVHPNGVAAYHEGERRRNEMLDVAMGLEERYRVLLPPDRRYLDRSERLKIVVEPLDASPEQDVEEPLVEVQDEPEDLEPEEVVIEAPIKQNEKLKFKLKIPSQERVATSPPKPTPVSVPVPVDVVPVPPKKKRQPLSPTVAKSPRLHKSQSHAPSPIASHLNTFSIRDPPTTDASSSPYPPIVTISEPQPTKPQKPQKSSLKQPTETGPRPRKRRRKGVTVESELEDVDMAPPPPEEVLANDLLPAVVSAAPTAPMPAPTPVITESISAPPVPRNRLVNRAQSHALSYRSSPKPTNLERTSCLLMVSAMRASSAPLARKTQRHVTAFGTKTPDALEEIREFDLPRWILHPEEEEEEARSQGDYRGQSQRSETQGERQETPPDEQVEGQQDENGGESEGGPVPDSEVADDGEEEEEEEEDTKEDVRDITSEDVEMEAAVPDQKAASPNSEELAASALLQL